MDQRYNWHSRVSALKAGNPRAAVALGGCRPAGSAYEDYANGERIHWGKIPAAGHWSRVDRKTGKVTPVKRGKFPGKAWLSTDYRLQRR